jgi:multidrug efflux pump subunit AcrB
LLFAGVMGVAGATGHFFAQIKGGPLFLFTFFPTVESGQIQVDITMPPDSSLNKTLEVVERVEKIAQGIPEVDYVTSLVGRQSAKE